MDDNVQAGSGGIGVMGLLGLLFITLKLTDVVDWSWWWVLAPFWAPVALGLILLAAFFAAVKFK